MSATLNRINCIYCLLAAFGLLSIGTAATAQELKINGYQIVMNDCALGCGPMVFDSQQAVSDYLSASTQARQVKLNSASGSRGAGRSGGNGLALGQRDNSPQVVFLDFDAGDSSFTIGNASFLGTFTSHVYTQPERDAIQARIESDYLAFNLEFSQTEPSSGEYTTLRFACPIGSSCITLTPDGFLSILFGRADNIDNLNTDRSDNAFVDANWWEFLVQFFGPNLFYSLTGIEPSGDVTADLSLAVVNQSANTGAHELGHILGLRHHDSFGAPGNGLPSTGVPDPFAFIPVYEGPQDADESILHLMASGASVGLPLSGSSNSDRFLSERSTVKLATNQRGRIVSEANASKGIVQLHNLVTANPLEIGENADGGLDVDAITVNGRISATGEVDAYRFKGKAGTFVTLDLISFADLTILDPVIGALDLYIVNEDGSRTLLESNIQTFEPFDPLIVDVELPSNATYEVEITGPNIVFIDLNGDGVPDPFPLDETGFGDFRFGDYFLNVYSATGKLGGGPSKVPGPTN